MRVLDRASMEQALPMEGAIGALEEAFRLHGQGRSTVPLRLPMETPQGTMLYMPALLRDYDEAALSLKVVAINPGNPEQSLPLIHALVLLSDVATGRPVALMEGGYLTGVRTGAASGLAAKDLAPGDAKHLGLIGCGFQAYFQVQALCAVRPIERVVLHNRSSGGAQSMKERLEGETDLAVEIASSGAEVAAEADVLVTATTSSEPVVSGHDLRPGTTVIAVGAFRPDMREVDTDLVTRAGIYVDSYEGALNEAGDLLIPLEQGHLQREEIRGELAELVSGDVPGRQSDNEVILFKSVGLAIEDTATAVLAYRNALWRGLGTEVEL